MKFFRITVEGRQYDVSVEELAEGAVSQPNYAPPVQVASTPVQAAPVTPKPSVPAATKPSAQAAAPKPSAPVDSGNSYELRAPMPGVILDLKVSVGASVKKNQVGAILEAMKMENEISIPVSGKVSSISVTKGATVNAGDLIMNIVEG